MTVGPLRRVSGAAGLVGLAPLGLGLATGRLDAVTAATRAGLLLLLVLVVGRIASAGVAFLARSLEDRSPGLAPATADRGDRRAGGR